MKVKVYWQQLYDDTVDLEDVFGITEDQFDNMSDEEQEEIEQNVLDFLREEIILQPTNVEYLRDE